MQGYALQKVGKFVLNHPEFENARSRYERIFHLDFKNLSEDKIKSSGYVVEAFSMFELVRDWKFEDESLLAKLGINIEEIDKKMEECKAEIQKLYPAAKYIAVNAGKYIIAKAEKFNQVMDFADDAEAREYLIKHHDETNGGAEESVKFVLNTQTWKCVFTE